MKTSGTFEVSLGALDSYATGMDGIALGRMSIDKEYHGELEAVSKGEMLSAVTAVEGSAGYVAIEQVAGALSEKQGSFVLMHFGTTSKAGERLILEVVPGSGSGGLAGIAGSMKIRNIDGQHLYEFEYELE